MNIFYITLFIYIYVQNLKSRVWGRITRTLLVLRASHTLNIHSVPEAIRLTAGFESAPAFARKFCKGDTPLQ